MTPSSESLRLAEQIAKAELASQQESSTTLRAEYLALADQLLIDDIEKTQIAKTAARLIEEQMNAGNDEKKRFVNSHFYRIMKEEGYTDPDLGRPEEFPLGEMQNTSYNGPNEALFRYCDKLISSARLIKQACKNWPEIGMTKEFLDDFGAACNAADEALDRKTQVPQRSQLILKHCMCAEAGMLNVGHRFLEIRMDIIKKARKWITMKQARKYELGREPNPLPILSPKNTDEALFLGFYGERCPECSSYRTEQTSPGTSVPGLVCTECNSHWTATTLLSCMGQSGCGQIFSEWDMAHIRRHGDCPNCKRKLPPLPAKAA